MRTAQFPVFSSAGGGIGGSIGATFDPTTLTGANIFQSDGLIAGALASLANAGPGIADAAVATGSARPTVVANQLNGYPAISFNGSAQVLSTTVGGGALTGSWYAFTLVNFASVSLGQQCVWSWGDYTAKKMRSLYAANNYLEVLGFSNDLNDGLFSLSTNTWYFVETQYDAVANFMTLWINGRMVASGTLPNSPLAYSNTAIVLGGDPVPGSLFDGSAVLWGQIPGLPTGATQQKIRAYYANKYGLTFGLAGTSAVGAVAKVSAANQLAESGIVDTGAAVAINSPIVIGGTYQGIIQSTGVTQNWKALLSVNGSFFVYSGGVNNQIGCQNGDVPLNLINYSAGGFSGMTGLDSGGGERMSISWGNANTLFPWTNCCHWEGSIAGDSSQTPPVMRIVQTGTINGTPTNHVQLEFDAAGNKTFYRNDAATGSQTKALQVDAKGNIYTGNGTTATTDTDGYFYMASVSGKPTGTPTNTPTGMVPWRWDHTNKKISVYDGSWLQTAALT